MLASLTLFSMQYDAIKNY